MAVMFELEFRRNELQMGQDRERCLLRHWTFEPGVAGELISDAVLKIIRAGNNQ